MQKQAKQQAESRTSTSIFLTCPRCEHRWEAAIVVEGAWWSVGATPERIAAVCYCPKCEAAPPMKLSDGKHIASTASTKQGRQARK